MATYTVTINERTNAGRQLLNYLLGLGLVRDKVASRRKTGFEEAEDDIKAGRVYTATSASDLFNQLMKDWCTSLNILGLSRRTSSAASKGAMRWRPWTKWCNCLKKTELCPQNTSRTSCRANSTADGSVTSSPIGCLFGTKTKPNWWCCWCEPAPISTSSVNLRPSPVGATGKWAGGVNPCRKNNATHRQAPPRRGK